jgi:hypothetical protein
VTWPGVVWDGAGCEGVAWDRAVRGSTAALPRARVAHRNNDNGEQRSI